MKKFFVFENILKFSIYVATGLVIGSAFVFSLRADVSDLNKRMINQEQKTNCLETNDNVLKIDIEVIKNDVKTIKDSQKETNGDIKTLLSRTR